MSAKSKTKRHILDGNMGDCMNSYAKAVAYLLVAALVISFSPQLCLADMVGNLNAGEGGGLIGLDGWDSDQTILEWTITNMGDYYKYCYELTVPIKSPSHMIFQVSDNFTEDDLIDVLTGQTIDFGEWGPGDSGEPNIPTTIFGIKFESSSEGVTETLCFTSYRMPMDGTFYSKGGKVAGISAVAYNDAANDYYVPVPDTYVPVPGAVLLGILGLGVAGVKLRKFA